MSTDKFPGSQDSGTTLLGLDWDWHKRPVFRTNKQDAASGPSVRTALMEFPIWEFEGSYEFLRERIVGQNDLHLIVGFFCNRRGRWDTFLFKDSDDYAVVNGPSLTAADGVTTMFDMTRTLGGFAEPVGQVDTDKTITVYHAPTDEAHTIPNTPGPYTVTIDHPQAVSAAITEDLGVKFTAAGTSLIKVASAPAAGQYSVNLATGVYTFNVADANKAIKITYRYVVLPANYTLAMPNRVVLVTAPTTGVVSMDFEFFFVCIFKEDMQDYVKFADKLWNLQTLEFETVPA